ncbi:MAG: cohesin domain-containing protein [Candidatus Daviesbacteria bacterium]|nr:cohesin domain-containing protein [Candidatus Daviesbacteria bacterium]
MIKYAISFFAFVLWFLVSPTGVFAQVATLSLDPATGTFNRNCPFSLNINLDTGGAQTDGTDAILFYDSSRLSITTSSITSNTVVYPDFPGNNVDEAAGKITISGLASVATPFTGKGTLATLNFTVKDSAPTGATQITFDFDPNNKAKTTDSNVVQRATIVDILNSVVNGNYTVGTGTCGTTTPSASPIAVVYKPTGSSTTSTPSATIAAPLPTKKTVLPPAGSEQLTFTVAIFGGVLTVLGILGLALL